jgi:hypothetical protein
MSADTVPLVVECDVHVRTQKKGRKELQLGADPRPAVPAGRVPRLARLMALAIRFEGLVRSGAVKDYAELARVGHVTRARVSQIMSLVNLDPAIQEDILISPLVLRGHDPLVLHDVLPIAMEPDWKSQRRLWAALQRRAAGAAGEG